MDLINSKKNRCLNQHCLYSTFKVHLCVCVCKGFFHGLGLETKKMRRGVFSYTSHRKKTWPPSVLRMDALMNYADKRLRFRKQ